MPTRSAMHRLLGRLGAADAVSLLNVVVGFAAGVVAVADPGLGARLVLFAAIADGLDGVVARAFGGSPLGEHLDSIADVASFGVTPALLLYGVFRAEWGGLLAAEPWQAAVALAVPSLFLVLSVLRTALYTVLEIRGEDRREGVPNTLVATLLAAAYLAGVTSLAVLSVATVVLSVLMIAGVPYPDLRARDALAMGGVQAGAVLAPTVAARLFPRALLVAGVLFLVGAPWFYWND